MRNLKVSPCLLALLHETCLLAVAVVAIVLAAARVLVEGSEQ